MEIVFASNNTKDGAGSVLVKINSTVHYSIELVVIAPGNFDGIFAKWHPHRGKAPFELSNPVGKCLQLIEMCKLIEP